MLPFATVGLNARLNELKLADAAWRIESCEITAEALAAACLERIGERDETVRAWAYMHRHYVDEWVREAMDHDCCWEEITFLNYVLSNYPDASWSGGVFTDAERKEMLDFSFRHWRQHSPLLKGYLTLTLKRMGRPSDARRAKGAGGGRDIGLDLPGEEALLRAVLRERHYLTLQNR